MFKWFRWSKIATFGDRLTVIHRTKSIKYSNWLMDISSWVTSRWIKYLIGSSFLFKQCLWVTQPERKFSLMRMLMIEAIFTFILRKIVLIVAALRMYDVLRTIPQGTSRCGFSRTKRRKPRGLSESTSYFWRVVTVWDSILLNVWISYFFWP